MSTLGEQDTVKINSTNENAKCDGMMEDQTTQTTQTIQTIEQIETPRILDERFERLYIVRLECIGALSYAFSSAKLPFILSCGILNNSDRDLQDVCVSFKFDFDFIADFEQTFPLLKSGDSIEFTPALKIQAKELFDLNETIRDKMMVEIVDGSGNVLLKEEDDFPILPMNQWSGSRIFPESLASFAMPNIPQMNELQARAAWLLKEKTGDSSFTGYLSDDKNLVRQQVAAIYAAIYEQNINYSIIPASFETSGQKIRLAMDVLKYKQGNCIEMSLLFASLCESCGLNPFIILTRRHAFAGVWLKDAFFEENVVSDLAQLRKRMSDGINDVELVECTCMNQGKQVPFENAVRIARGLIDDTDDFELLIDIKRSHYCGIRPMPVKVVEDGESKIVDYGLAEDAVSMAETTKEIEERFLDLSQKEELSKSGIWMRNLLDLSKRNALISFRPGQKTIQIFNSELGALEDALSKGESFEIREIVSDWRGDYNRVSFADVQSQTEAISRISNAEFKSRRLRTFLKKDELEKTLKTLYRDSKIALEENGANTLYLAMGFLQWVDPQDPADAEGRIPVRLAPLVLLPVDLIRRARGAYQLALRDEDAQMNITLLEMLRQRFDLYIGGLDTLPLDEFGVDLPLVFNSIRQAIMKNEGWDVLELACLGLFSFSQFVMWNDLKTRFEMLAENKVVKGLINGRFKDYSEEVLPGKIDENHQVADLAIPMSIDSSQLAAVIEASKGSSFVLHGPPGTGKSQTITNLIANALYQGKSVLFVAEKMVALNVVQERLEAIRLGDFCLEIHSNKTQKRVVLEKLEKNISMTRMQDSKSFKEKAAWIQRLKDRLNGDIFELHKARNQGISLYDAIGYFSEYKNEKRPYQIPRSVLEKLNSNQFNLWEESIRVVARAASFLGKPYDLHPLRHFKKESYTLQNRRILEELLTEAIQQVQAIENQINQNFPENANEVGFLERMITIDALIGIAHTVEQRNIKTQLDVSQFTVLLDPDTVRIIGDTVTEAQEFARFKQTLLKTYTYDVETFDWASVRKDFIDASNAIFMKSRKQSIALTGLNSITKQSSIAPQNALEELGKIASYQENKQKLFESLANSQKILGVRLAISADDIDALEDLLKLAQTVESIRSGSGLPLDKLYQIYSCVIQMTDHDEIAMRLFLKMISNLKSTLKNIEAITGIDSVNLFKIKNWSQNLLHLLEEWRENLDLWKDWNSFYASLLVLRELELDCVVDSLLGTAQSVDTCEHEHTIRNEDVAKRFINEFYSCFYHDLINFYLEESDSLARFNGLQIEARIEEYNKLLDEYEELSKEQIRIKLSQQIPDQKTCSDEEAKQLANLTRVIHSKGRGTSIRKLFQDSNQVIKKLTPCLLMSPLSVAQYIDPAFPRFDLVIFDEASQIRTSVAIGAMSRAKDCIIVGDPKQMPPTDFFSNKKLDEDNINIEDLESLLDDCLAINMPQRYLDWHYRSQSESLISFSNKMYYGNSMKTVPSPYDRLSKVTFVKVNGVYDRGATRTNPSEAKAIVKEIVRRLRDPELRNDSIGVVTFNMSQQVYIDDLLQDELRKDAQLDKIYQNLDEQVFIKNLENVQGDERDVILFSIGYGPDADGKITMNFGPLNRKGGWRRLNVAVSRSRVEMQIYASFEPEDIAIRSTTSEGVIGIRYFLEFAKYGRLGSSDNRESISEKLREKLIDDIAKTIEAKGYVVDKNIGSSGFTLDLAIVDPRMEGRYLCAILLDGRQYAKANTARDRYRLMPSILNFRGWEVYRIWALDWYDNQKIEESRLFSFIEKILAKEVLDVPAAHKHAIAVKAISPNIEKVTSGGNHAENHPVEIITTIADVIPLTTDADREISAINHAPVPKTNQEPVLAQRLENKVQSKGSESSVVQRRPIRIDYIKTELKDSYFDQSIEDHKGRIIEMMQQIIDAEGPVAVMSLYRNIMSCFPNRVLNKKNILTLKNYLSHCRYKSTKQGNEEFCWPIDQNPAEYDAYRIPTAGTSRDVDFISDYELANFIWAVVIENLDDDGIICQLSEEEITRQILYKLGYSRTTDRMIAVVKSAFRNAVRRKLIGRKGKRITIGAINH